MCVRYCVYMCQCVCVCSHSAAVVNEACQVSTFGGIDDGVMIDAEQVAAPDPLLSVTLLTIISHHLKALRINTSHTLQ